VNQAYDLIVTRLLSRPQHAGSNDKCVLDRILSEESDSEFDDCDDSLLALIRLMGKTGVCSHLLKENVQCKLLDCSIKVLMQREFIDVLLPWVSRIVHDSAQNLIPNPKKGDLRTAASSSA